MLLVQIKILTIIFVNDKDTDRHAWICYIINTIYMNLLIKALNDILGTTYLTMYYFRLT